MKIGIVYFVTGDYCSFWEEFYLSCERFFCMDSKKNYYLFTDNEDLLDTRLPHVRSHRITDQGWLVNVSRKNEFIVSIQKELEENDYIFYLNGNYRPVRPIYTNEIIPGKQDGYLVGLSFHVYRHKRASLLPYERNVHSKAYIPYGMGDTYFQGGFYGGRTKELLDLARWCFYAYSEDRKNDIIALNHDESYLNRYLMNRSPKILGTEYAKPQEWDTPGECKAFLADKNSISEMRNTVYRKEIYLSPELHYLLDEEKKLSPVHIVKLFGGLGNQMFQYAFYLGLKMRKENPYENVCVWMEPLAHTESQYITTIFQLSHLKEISPDLRQCLATTPAKYIQTVGEEENSVPMETIAGDFPLNLYSGYWQTEQYFKAFSTIIRTEFLFDEKRLNEKTKLMLEEINKNRGNSVSIHIRRGDYEMDEAVRQKHGGICTVRYYQESMVYMQGKIGGDCVFYLFSDDPLWVMEKLYTPDRLVIDWNKGDESWQDMLLMSACSHHIIANSSFSWWAAWLGDYEGKIVAAPSKWYNDDVAPYILPESWKAEDSREYQ